MNQVRLAGFARYSLFGGFFKLPASGSLRGSVSAFRTWRSCSSLADKEVLNKPSAVDDKSLPGARTGGDKLAMLFTCTVCDTRSGKIMTKNAYENGVVIAICPGCENKHLIADNLGWFGDGRIDVESMLAAKGEQITRSQFTESGGTLELTEDDLAILSSGQPILRQTEPAEAGTQEEGDAPNPAAPHSASDGKPER